MKKEEIKSRELKRILEAKFDVFDFKDIKDEELDSVNKLFVRKRKLNGEETDIHLSEISNFKGLNELRLLGFRLTKDDMKIITNMKLESLVLSNCEFENIESLNMPKLKDLVIFGGENVENVFIKSPEMLIIEGTDLDFSKIDILDTKQINMFNCNIKNMDSLKKYDKLEFINFDGSIITDTNGKELKSTNDINVGENVVLSFEEEYRKTGLNN